MLKALRKQNEQKVTTELTTCELKKEVAKAVESAKKCVKVSGMLRNIFRGCSDLC